MGNTTLTNLELIIKKINGLSGSTDPSVEKYSLVIDEIKEIIITTGNYKFYCECGKGYNYSDLDLFHGSAMLCKICNKFNSID